MKIVLNSYVIFLSVWNFAVLIECSFWDGIIPWYSGSGKLRFDFTILIIIFCLKLMVNYFKTIVNGLTIKLFLINF